MSMVKAVDGKGQSLLKTVRHFGNGDIPSSTVLVPCLTEWPTNELELLAPPSFPTKGESTWPSKVPSSACGKADALHRALVVFAGGTVGPFQKRLMRTESLATLS